MSNSDDVFTLSRLNLLIGVVAWDVPAAAPRVFVCGCVPGGETRESMEIPVPLPPHGGESSVAEDVAGWWWTALKHKHAHTVTIQCRTF